MEHVARGERRGERRLTRSPERLPAPPGSTGATGATRSTGATGAGDGGADDLAERVRLRAEILYAMLSLERRTAVRRADLDRADALAGAILARRRRIAS